MQLDLDQRVGKELKPDEAEVLQRNSAASGVTTWTYWYNSAVKRFVAAEMSNVTADGKVLAQERFELASYEVK